MYSFVDDLKANHSCIVELCSAENADGRAFHAFIKMTPDNYAKYKQALKLRAPLDLLSFGEVIHTGWGAQPDEVTKTRIMNEHTDNQKIKEELTRHAMTMQRIIRKHTQRDKYHGRITET